MIIPGNNGTVEPGETLSIGMESYERVRENERGERADMP